MGKTGSWMEVIVLDWWSNFCGDAMAMVFFWKRCDTNVFGHTLPCDYLDLSIFHDVIVLHEFWLVFMVVRGTFMVFNGFWLVFMGFSTAGAWDAMYRSSLLVIDRKYSSRRKIQLSPLLFDRSNYLSEQRALELGTGGILTGCGAEERWNECNTRLTRAGTWKI